MPPNIFPLFELGNHFLAHDFNFYASIDRDHHSSILNACLRILCDKGKVIAFYDMNAPAMLKLNAQQFIMKNLGDIKGYMYVLSKFST